MEEVEDISQWKEARRLPRRARSLIGGQGCFLRGKLSAEQTFGGEATANPQKPAA
jgi:hypothetical protein